MIHAKDGTEVLDNLQPVKSPGTGIEHWGSSYFGPRYSTAGDSAQPQALMTQMCANETILPHFHGLAQFQIFPCGSGVMGKGEVQPLMLQYKDHHTAYGPLVAGAHGLTFIALRNRIADSAPVYLGKPGYQEKLKPSKRRNWMSSHIALSTRPVLQFRKEVSWEPVYDPRRSQTRCRLSCSGSEAACRRWARIRRAGAATTCSSRTAVWRRQTRPCPHGRWSSSSPAKTASRSRPDATGSRRSSCSSRGTTTKFLFYRNGAHGSRFGHLGHGECHE